MTTTATKTKSATSTDSDFYTEWVKETCERLEAQSPSKLLTQRAGLMKVRVELTKLGLEPMIAMVGRATVMLVVEPPTPLDAAKTQRGSKKEASASGAAERKKVSRGKK